MEPFTLVGATTRSGLLTGPMRDRFGFVGHLDFYAPAELTAAAPLGPDPRASTLDRTGRGEIAGRSRGTPRIANRLLRRVRDFAEVRADGVDHRGRPPGPRWRSTTSTSSGLDRLDKAVLGALCRSFGGGPVGLSTLAVAVGEQPDTVEEVCEPFLVRAGMLARTPRGRVATPAAWAHLGLDAARDAGRDGIPAAEATCSTACRPRLTAARADPVVFRRREPTIMPDSGSVTRTRRTRGRGWAGTYGARPSLGARTTITRPLRPWRATDNDEWTPQAAHRGEPWNRCCCRS